MRPVLVNALWMGGGGGITVAREVARHVARELASTRLVLMLRAGNPLHEELRSEAFPQNVMVDWAPAGTVSRWKRKLYERERLAELIREHGAGLVLQMNGAVVGGLPIPTISHCGDPWPYVPEAWSYWYDPLLAIARRRQHRHALRYAAEMGFTSTYLHDLVIARAGFKPRRSAVYYNGVPADWVARANDALPALRSRPMEILTVSNVSEYKGQHRVVEALPSVLKRLGDNSLVYRIAGQQDSRYAARLRGMIRSLDLERNVVLEGRVSNDRVRELYERARVFLLPSLCESFGIPVVEAMSFGVPVIAARAAALPEICGDAGVLVDVARDGELGSSIARLLTDETEAERLRHRGFRRVRDFSWADTATRLARSIRELST